jgi:hypothetical protein
MDAASRGDGSAIGFLRHVHSGALNLPRGLRADRIRDDNACGPRRRAFVRGARSVRLGRCAGGISAMRN